MQSLKIGFLMTTVGARELLKICSEYILHIRLTLGLSRALTPHSKLGIPLSWIISWNVLLKIYIEITLLIQFLSDRNGCSKGSQFNGALRKISFNSVFSINVPEAAVIIWAEYLGSAAGNPLLPHQAMRAECLAWTSVQLWGIAHHTTATLKKSKPLRGGRCLLCGSCCLSATRSLDSIWISYITLLAVQYFLKINYYYFVCVCVCVTLYSAKGLEF